MLAIVIDEPRLMMGVLDVTHNRLDARAHYDRLNRTIVNVQSRYDFLSDQFAPLVRLPRTFTGNEFRPKDRLCPLILPLPTDF